MKIEYDKPIEVTESQYRKIITVFSGSVAHRNENGKYFIKVWDMRIKYKLLKYLVG